MLVRRVMIAVFMVAMATLIAAPAVDAKGGSWQERRITLTRTAEGKADRVSYAKARTRERGSRQVFKAEIKARVADGTQYTVQVTNGGTTVTAGVLTIKLGRAELELKNYDGKTLPAGIAPVGKITTVTILNASGVVVASGSF